MNSMRPLAGFVILACLLGPAARAASGGIDSFWSSATRVPVGGSVDFSVSFSLSTNRGEGGGSNPFEPTPAEGYQEWYVNWYGWDYETLGSVWLQAGGESFADYPSLAAGESYGNTWSFTVTFAEPGTFDVEVAGGRQSTIIQGYSSESATRNCYALDPDAGTDLQCDSWSWQYSDADDWYTLGGDLRSGSLRIEVIAAAVPEPGTWALMLAGAALVAARSHRALQAARRRGTGPSTAA